MEHSHREVMTKLSPACVALSLSRFIQTRNSIPAFISFLRRSHVSILISPAKTRHEGELVAKIVASAQ